LTALLFDTSVFVGGETTRLAQLPQPGAISIVTLGELTVGVILASADEREQRLATLDVAASEFEAIPIDTEIARAWGGIASRLRRLRRRVPVNDCWIAATARVHDLAVVTQDADFDDLGVEVVRL